MLGERLVRAISATARTNGHFRRKPSSLLLVLSPTIFTALAFLIPGCSASLRPSTPRRPVVGHTRVAPPVLVPFTPPKPGDAPRSFAEIAALPDGRFDLGETAAALREEISAALPPDRRNARARRAELLRALDRWGKKIAADLPENYDGLDVCETLRDVFFKDFDAAAGKELRAEDFDLERVLRERRGDCLSAGLLALAAARRAGISLYGAQCPGHFFLRYVGPPDEQGRREVRNFDPTRPNLFPDDDFYRRRRGFDRRAERLGIYLQPLSDRQTAAVWLSARAGWFCRNGLYGRAYRDAERALSLDPKCIPAWLNRGAAAAGLKRRVKAEESYRGALALDPRAVQALAGLAALYVSVPSPTGSELKEARRFVNSALQALGERRRSAAFAAQASDKGRRRRLRRPPDEEARTIAYVRAVNAEVYAAEKKPRAAVREMQAAVEDAPGIKSYRRRLRELRRVLREQTEKGVEGKLGGFGLRP